MSDAAAPAPAADAAPALEVRNLVRAYGEVKAVNDVSFSVRPGEILALLGPNGAGKSSILRTIAGLQRPDRGEVLIAGVSVQKDPIAARRALGFLPEESILYPDLTGREALQMSGALRGLSPAAIEEKSAALLRFFELDGAADRPVSGYSRGMRRKTAMSVALLGEPPVLVLDEPTGGLDPPSTALFRSVLDEARRRGKAILWSSHLLSEVARDADRCAIIERGEVIATGTSEQLREKAELPPEATLEDVFLKLTGRERRSAAELFGGTAEAKT